MDSYQWNGCQGLHSAGALRTGDNDYPAPPSIQFDFVWLHLTAFDHICLVCLGTCWWLPLISEFPSLWNFLRRKHLDFVWLHLTSFDCVWPHLFRLKVLADGSLRVPNLHILLLSSNQLEALSSNSLAGLPVLSSISLDQNKLKEYIFYQSTKNKSINQSVNWYSINKSMYNNFDQIN